MQLFFSYGHDRHKEFVELLKQAIEEESKGEILVWMDTHEIERDSHWRAKITDGINKCERVFAFLSEYSVRIDSVCRDELSIALASKHGMVKSILLEPADKIAVPALLSEYQWGDLSAYPEEKLKGEAVYMEYVRQEAKKIIALVKSPEMQRYSAEVIQIRKLLGMPEIDSITKFDSLLKKELIGREWLVEEIQKWVNDENGKQILMLYGKPGAGKSMFASKLQLMCPNVVAAFPCDCRSELYSSTDSIIRNIAYRLALRLPDYRRWILNLKIDQFSGQDLFDCLITQPLSMCAIDGKRDPLVILVDALDEMKTDELATFISENAKRLRKYVKFIITSRQEKDIVSLFETYDVMNLDENIKNGEKDLREYFIWRLEEQLGNNPSWNEFLDKLVKSSELVFAYAECVCDSILDDLKDEHFELKEYELPKGLNGLFKKTLDRRFGGNAPIDSFEKWRIPLGIILASPEPISTDTYKTLLDWSDRDYEKFKDPLSTFLIEVDGCLQVFHKSFAEWIQKKAEIKYVITEQDAVEYFASMCAELYEYAPSTMDDYLILYTTQMLRKSKKRESQKYYWQIVQDSIYVERIATIGLKLKEEQRIQTAYKYLREYMDIYKDLVEKYPEDVEYKKNYGDAIFVAGNISRRLNNFKDALAIYSQGLKISGQFIETYPEITDYRSVHTQMLRNMGSIYEELEDPEKALTYNLEALEIARELVNQFPENMDYWRGLGDVCSAIGAVYKDLGDSEKALEHYFEDLEIRKILLQSDGENIGYLSDYGVSCNHVGSIYEEIGDYEEALNYYITFMEIHHKLSNEHPENIDYLHTYSLALACVGSVYKCMKKYETALVYYSVYLSIVRKLSEQYPNVPSFQENYAIALVNIGEAYMKMKQPEAALEYYLHHLDIRKMLKEQYSEQTIYQAVYGVALSLVGECYEALGQTDEAQKYRLLALEET